MDRHANDWPVPRGADVPHTRAYMTTMQGPCPPTVRTRLGPTIASRNRPLAMTTQVNWPFLQERTM